jgi:HAD superfamily hydrolase (TIGR01509 family)
MLAVQALAFDLDDTLTDWWTGICLAAQAIGDTSLSDRVARDTWVRRDGIVVNRHHWRVLREPAMFVDAQLVDDLVATLDPPLFDDVRSTFDALRGRIRLALLTNNPYGEEVLRRHGLDTEVFECVVVADPGVRKPDPRAFAPLLEALALPASLIAYVGDSVTADVEGARAAGLRPVWLDRWDDGWAPDDDVHRIRSLHDLTSLV